MAYYPGSTCEVSGFTNRFLEHLYLSHHAVKQLYPAAVVEVCGDLNNLSHITIARNLQLRQLADQPARGESILVCIFAAKTLSAYDSVAS